MVNIRFEFSKDYVNWVDTLNGEDITKYTITGSYDVRQGYNLSEIPRASTFSMDVVMDFELGKAILEYPFIKIYKNDELTFTGVLDPKTERDIETLHQQVISIKYIHLLRFLEEQEVEGDIRFEATDYHAMKVLDSTDTEHSLVHYLVGRLLSKVSIPFVFKTNLIATDSSGQPIKVLLFSATGGDNLWDVLNNLLREYGYVLRVNNLQLSISDILAKPSQAGIELLDGADISVKTTEEEMSLPKSVGYYKTVTDTNATIYQGTCEIGGFLWWGKSREDQLTLKYERLGDNVTLLDVDNVDYSYYNPLGDLAGVYGVLTSWHGRETVGRKMTYEVGVYYEINEKITADVTYAVYSYTTNTSVLPEGFSKSNEHLKPKFLYGSDQVERYIESLAVIKRFKKTEWTFYSKVKLNVDDIVRFKDIPDSTCRIFEVQDTLEMDGGYTYRAFPFPVDHIQFEHKEEDLNPAFGNSVRDIQEAEPIFVENGIYRKEKWRIYILTTGTYINPDVTVDNVDYKVQYDTRLGKYYIDVALTDADKKHITVSATVEGVGITKEIGIYQFDNRPVIIEYKYSTSSSDPNFDDLQIKYGDYFLYYGNYLIGWGEEQWTQQIPQGSQYDEMFLWKRTWNYNIQEWVYELLTPVVKEFEIFASSSIYPISKRQVVDPVINVGYKQKGIQGAVTMTTSFGTIEDVGNKQWKLTIPSQSTEKTITITATLGTLVRTLDITGVKQADDAPIYFGKLADAPSGGRYVVGDYYLATDNIPWRWNGNEWKKVESTDSNYSEIMSNVMADAFSDESQVIPSQSVIWQYVKNLMVNDATVENLVARNLKVEDKQKKFKAQIKGEDTTPAVFDVDYDGKPIFKIVPEKGDIFLGEPNRDLSAPVSGFMYKSDTQQFIASRGKFIVGADGAIEGDTIQLLTQLQDSNIRLNKRFFDKDEQVTIPENATDYEQIAIIDSMFDKYKGDAYDVHTDASVFAPEGKILFLFALADDLSYASGYRNFNYIYYINDNRGGRDYYVDNFLSKNGSPYHFASKYSNGGVYFYLPLTGFTFKGVVSNSIMYGNTEVRGNFRASNFYTTALSEPYATPSYFKRQVTQRVGNLVTYYIQVGLSAGAYANYLRITFPAPFKEKPCVFVNYEKSDEYADGKNYGFIMALTTTYVEVSVYGSFDQHIMITGEIDSNLISAIEWSRL